MERILVQRFERRIKETRSKSPGKHTSSRLFFRQAAVDTRDVVVVKGRKLTEASTFVMFLTTFFSTMWPVCFNLTLLRLSHKKVHLCFCFQFSVPLPEWRRSRICSASSSVCVGRYEPRGGGGAWSGSHWPSGAFDAIQVQRLKESKGPIWLDTRNTFF